MISTEDQNKEISMLQTLLIIGFGLLGGIAVGMQAPMASLLGQKLGGFAGGAILYTGGLVLIIPILLARRGENLAHWDQLPWYVLASGSLGLIFFLSLRYTIPALGATTAISLVIVGQLFAGMLIDHFGAFSVPIHTIDLQRLLASSLLLFSAYLMIRS